MNVRTGTPRALRINWRRVSLLILAAGLSLLAAANAHLVYVALDTRPDCVPHAKSAGENGTFRAARSAC